jgi:alpha-amylase
VFGHGIARDAWFDHGFDSLINFAFQRELQHAMQGFSARDEVAAGLYWYRLDKLYADYAATLAAPRCHDVLSYISSHDTELFERDRLFEASAALLMLPGGVLLLYGDETGRSPGSECPADPTQPTRSPMRWEGYDEILLHHWQLLGRFRARHPAIARGAHTLLCERPYVFARCDLSASDEVVIVMGCRGPTRIPVASMFADGDRLADAYSGCAMTVLDGHVLIDVQGVALLERATGQ